MTVVAVIVVAVAAAAGAWAWHAHRGTKPLWRTGTVRKGNLTAMITATGTVEPEEVVDVGAQVSGQFLNFGKDKNGKPIDYGTVVKSNDLLASIDTNIFQADVNLDMAMVDSDKAGEKQAEANVEQMIAKEAEADADWKRAQILGPSEALAPTTYDSYKANYEIAKANLDLALAAVDSAKAATKQAQATLAKAKQTLQYCTIVSPVDGVIIDRRVTIGETVASSLNTPSLFLIAKDLTRIQVWASVNEADIGSIHTDQDVTFTVDAFPNRTFHGKVNKVRLNATMTQNVVTYTVEVNTDNSDGKLLPYLTANVNFLTGQATNVLLVLNSALRWHPQKDLIAPQYRQPANEADGAPPGARAARNAGGTDGPSAASAGSGQGAAPMQIGMLWAAEGNFVRPVPVKLGLTDGTWTEVQGESLTKGMVVVTGTLSAEAAAEEAAGANPFIPQIGRRGGPGGGGGGRRGGG
ncbi:MAG TPA: efflux RND transporter periplasmic adaptor subunit [Candidatus Acidoferrum sp.]|nr:efflux RND transporter periplasmic adaptor subunit [Candidatus Acidoferrum sp.]